MDISREKVLTFRLPRAVKEKLNNLRVLIFILIFNFLGGYISSLLSGDQKLVYNSLEKPWFSPPSIVFPIVWSILYFLLAVAIFLNYKKGGIYYGC